MLTKAGMRRFASLMLALMCTIALTCGACAEGAMDFSEWLVKLKDNIATPDATEAEPAPEQTATEAEPASEQAGAEAEPVPEQPVTEAEPALEQTAMEDEPAPEQVATEAELVSEQAGAEAEPVPEQPVTEDESAPEQAAMEAEPVPEQPAVEATPTPELPQPTPVPELPEAIALPMDDAFEASPTLEPVETLRSARIRAVGDLMVHKQQLTLARQSDGSYDFHPQYELIADSLANADYTIANLETTIGKHRDLAYSGFPMFNTPEALLDAVRDAGVDFLTLANNHMLDRYFEGMVNTVNFVEQYGFDFGGANRTPEERDAPVVVEVNGIHIGFLCYTQMTNGMESYCSDDVEEYGVNYLRKANFAADVQKLRDAGADVVIALPHWGEEYRRRPDGNTVALAKLLIASGVDVILGSHPHMVQPVEFLEVETKDGGKRTGLVAYSLGNFISNMSVRYTDSGVILEFTIQELQDGGFSITNVGCVPIYCWRGQTIQSLSSLKYLDAPPEGMRSDAVRRMKESYQELCDLLGDDIVMLAE